MNTQRKSKPIFQAAETGFGSLPLHIGLSPPLSTSIEIQIADMETHHRHSVNRLYRETKEFTTAIGSTNIDDLSLDFSAGGREALIVTASDRERKYGIVGFMLFAAGETSLRVDSFLLQRRIWGKGIEHQMLILLGAIAQLRGLSHLIVRYTCPERNDSALKFLDNLGYAYRHAEGDSLVYELPASYVAALGSCQSMSVCDDRSAPTSPK